MNKTIHSGNKNQYHHIFSRDTLEQTFKLLRKHSPPLALAVQNALNNSEIATPVCPPTDHATHHFQHSSDRLFINLEARTIGKIVAALTELGQEALSHKEKKSGKLVLLRALICDWINLAEWIVLQAEPTPTTYH